MALPTSFDQVTLHGKFLNLDGTPANGTVTFVGGQRLRMPGDDIVVIPATFTVNVVDGEFTQVLPATDDPDTTPIGWVYTVTETFNSGNYTNTYTLSIPVASAGLTLELADLLPASSGTPAPDNNFVRTVNGLVGDVTLTNPVVTVSSTEPVAPAIGDIWFQTV